MSEQRYDALITALLQLRTPKLSQRLDPVAAVHAAVAGAAPARRAGDRPSSPRASNGSTASARSSTGSTRRSPRPQRLAARQQTYAQRVLRAGAAALISATTDMDGLTRTARESEEQLVEPARPRSGPDALRPRRTAPRKRETDIEALRSRRTTRRAPPRCDRLDERREQAEKAGRRRQHGARSAGRPAGRPPTTPRLHRQGRRREAVLTCRAPSSSKHRPRGRPGRGLAHRPRRGGRARPDRPAPGAGVSSTRAVASRHARSRRYGAATRRARGAVERRGGRGGALEEARETLATARPTEPGGEARSTKRGGSARPAARLGHWLRGAAGRRRGVLAAVDDEPSSPPSVDAAVDRSPGELAAAEAEAASAAGSRPPSATGSSSSWPPSGPQRTSPPLAPATRTADRARMAGAPLWRLVDFVERAPGRVPAAVEAALEAAGLLDAWVAPDGEVDRPRHDVLADPAQPRSRPREVARRRAAAGGGTPVPVERIRAWRRRVRRRAARRRSRGVGADGTWRLGAVTGSWAKPEPEHIGATARARARERRIAELLARRRRIGTSSAELARVRGRRGGRWLAAERAARPDHGALDAARSRAGQRRRARSARPTRVGRWVRAGGTSVVRTRARADRRRRASTGLPTRPDELDRLGRAVDTSGPRRPWLDGAAELRAARDAAATAAQRRGPTASAARARRRPPTQAELAALASAVAPSRASIGHGLPRDRRRSPRCGTPAREAARKAADAARDGAELDRRHRHAGEHRRGGPRDRGTAATAPRRGGRPVRLPHRRRARRSTPGRPRRAAARRRGPRHARGGAASPRRWSSVRTTAADRRRAGAAVRGGPPRAGRARRPGRSGAGARRGRPGARRRRRGVRIGRPALLRGRALRAQPAARRHHRRRAGSVRPDAHRRHPPAPRGSRSARPATSSTA